MSGLAVAAFKHGSDDDLASYWAAKARSAGTDQLLRSMPGLQLLFWHTLPPAGRRVVRSAQHSAREAVKAVNLRVRGGPGSRAIAGRDEGAAR